MVLTKKVSAKNAKDTSKPQQQTDWVKKTKAFSQTHNIPYGQALQNPSHRLNYHNSQAINQGMLPTCVRIPALADHSGYRVQDDEKVMKAYASLAKLQHNLHKTSPTSTRKYYI